MPEKGVNLGLSVSVKGVNGQWYVQYLNFTHGKLHRSRGD